MTYARGGGYARADGPPGGASSPPWDFGYAPVATAASDDDGGPLDVVIATSAAIAPETVAAALASVVEAARVEVVLERAPVFWLRARAGEASQRAIRADVLAALCAAAVPARYVASCLRPSGALGLQLGAAPSALPRPDGWRTRRPSSAADPDTPGRWFLRDGDGGIAVDRRRCGGGAGMRLAVIDDDAAASDQLDLEREVLVMLDRPPRSQSHGALMVAWAVGGQRPGDFRGVAPDASPRLYLIPKPGACLLALPLAILRAVIDGADAVVCATYVEGSTTPMLDDALAFASRFGRRGRGCPVVFPTGREASSMAGSLHASFSLGFGEPASDPRVFCVGPSARGDGWFLWRDRKGRSRPFANRGPAVRWLAPGDDMAYPFRPGGGTGPVSERLFHAESSGASAVAAGVLLLVLARNPTLRTAELETIITRTLDPVAPTAPASAAPLADPSDLLPGACDRDGHNAKHGYGRIHAGRACLAASDPIALALVLLGDDHAARAWHDARRVDPLVRTLYSRRLARWAVRALLADSTICHGLCAVLRHGRLVACNASRREAHGRGAVFRQAAIVARGLALSRTAPKPLPTVRLELAALIERFEQEPRDVDAFESAFSGLMDHLFRTTTHQETPEVLSAE